MEDFQYELIRCHRHTSYQDRRPEILLRLRSLDPQLRYKLPELRGVAGRSYGCHKPGRTDARTASSHQRSTAGAPCLLPRVRFGNPRDRKRLPEMWCPPALRWECPLKRTES